MAFEGILSQPDQKPSRRRRLMLAVSLWLHGGAVVAGIVHSIWQVDELPMPQIQVSLVADVPPPPPPPPPPARKTSTTKTKTTTKVVEKTNAIVQPKENQKPAEPEKPEPESQDEGVEGGVEGGVAGGVVGGVVGNQPPPPPPKTGPKLVDSVIGKKQLLINPDADPYKVKLPRALEASGQSFTARFRVCVSAQGTVYDVRILKPAGPAIDSQIPTVVRRWRYRPLQVDGRPTPFCYPVVYQIG